MHEGERLPNMRIAPHRALAQAASRGNPHVASGCFIFFMWYGP
jgi:hypothetical protein